MDISELNLDWSEEKRIQTKFGPRMLKKAESTPEFWDEWNDNKQELKALGISVSKNFSGDWEVCHWREFSEEEKEAVENSIKASKAAGSDIEIPSPDGLDYMPFQKAGIEYALGKQHVIIGDEMGLGKTIQAVGVVNANEDINNVLVICPASLRLNWRNEARKWLVREFNIGVVDCSDYPEDANFLIINYDVLKKHHDRLRKVDWDVVIIDEAHYLKNPKAQRTKEIFGKKGKGKKKGEYEVAPLKTNKFIALTGTPILNRPVELWPMLSAFDPDDLGKNWFSFTKRFCNAHRNRFGFDVSGASNLEELQLRLRENVLIRRLKKDVLKDLPAKIRQVIELPSDEMGSVVREREAYKRHQKDLERLKAEVELAKASDNEEEYKNAINTLKEGISAAFSELAALRHDVAVEKIPAVIEHLKNALEEGPVVCFAHHRDVLEAIQEAILDSRIIYGGTPLEERQAAVDDFQNGKYDLFLGSIKAAGVGLTLTRASRVIFAELDWTPSSISQAEDRCHRIGQEDSVLVQHIVLEESLDANIAKTLVGKQNVIEKALDKGDVLNSLKSEPVIPLVSKGNKEAVHTEKDSLAEEAKNIKAPQRQAILEGLQLLSAMCDGARAVDGSGFNKIDTHIGKDLAARDFLTPKQAALGKRLVNKYRGQLPEDMLTSAGIEI